MLRQDEGWWHMLGGIRQGWDYMAYMAYMVYMAYMDGIYGWHQAGVGFSLGLG